jgi:hypothetical protein
MPLVRTAENIRRGIPGQRCETDNPAFSRSHVGYPCLPRATNCITGSRLYMLSPKMSPKTHLVAAWRLLEEG